MGVPLMFIATYRILSARTRHFSGPWLRRFWQRTLTSRRPTDTNNHRAFSVTIRSRRARKPMQCIGNISTTPFIMNTRFNHLFAFLFIITLTACVQGCKTAKPATSESTVDSSAVFVPGGEYASMRIPALVMTKRGTLLAFCEGRIATASDWADMDMLMRRSADRGRTWEPVVVIAPRQGGKPTSNPTPIVDNEGTIHLLYQRDYARAYYIFSKDDGKTWSAPAD